MYLQYILAVLMLFIFIGLSFLIEGKLHSKAIALFKNESKRQSFIGAIGVNLFLIVYSFVWLYLI